MEVTACLLTQLLNSCQSPWTLPPRPFIAFWWILASPPPPPPAPRHQQLNFSLSLFLSLDKPPGLPYPLTFGEIISLPFSFPSCCLLGLRATGAFPHEPWLTVPLLGSLPLPCCPQRGPASLPEQSPVTLPSRYSPSPVTVSSSVILPLGLLTAVGICLANPLLELSSALSSELSSVTLRF